MPVPHSSDGFSVVTKKHKKIDQILVEHFGLLKQDTRGDGHYILYSFQDSWTNQVKSRISPTQDIIISSLFVECVTNRDKYLPFTTYSPSEFTKCLGNYLSQKVYLNSFCDLVPLILANAFHVKIHILNHVNGKVHTHDVVPFDGKFQFSVFILREGDHYCALRPSAKPVLVETNTPTLSNVSNFSLSTTNRFELLQTDVHLHDSDVYSTDFPTLESAKLVPKKKRVTMPKFIKKKTPEQSTKELQSHNDSDYTCSDVLVIGTSHVRGVGAALNKVKINAVSLSNPGREIQHISRRIHHMVPKDFRGNILLQVGGNDCCEVDSEMVICRYEALLFLIRQIAPRSHILISEIPPRVKTPYVSYKIRTVNNFLHHLSLFEANVFYISHPYFINKSLFKKDGVHLNNNGFQYYVSHLADTLQDFRLAKSFTNQT